MKRAKWIVVTVVALLMVAGIGWLCCSMRDAKQTAEKTERLIRDTERYEAEVGKYREQALARGEKLEWKEFAPPEIPRGREIHEKVIAAREAMGSDWPRPVYDMYLSNENGWQREFDRELVRKFLDDQAEALALLDAILDSPRATPPFNAEAETIADLDLDVILPQLANIRSLARLAAIRIRYIVETEGANQGLDAVARAYPLTSLYRDEPLLITRLVEFAVQRILTTTTRGIVAQAAEDVDPEAIRRLAQTIAEAPPPGFSAMFQAERASAILPLAKSEDAWRRSLAMQEYGAYGWVVDGTNFFPASAMSDFPLFERWRNYASVLKAHDPLMAIATRLDKNPDDSEARNDLDGLEREGGVVEAINRDRTAFQEAVDGVLLKQLGRSFPGKSAAEIRTEFAKKQAEALKAMFPGKSNDEGMGLLGELIKMPREEQAEFFRRESAEGAAFSRIDPSKFDVEMEYAPAAFTFISGRAAVMGLRALADRRMTAFGLELWADTLEGKPLPETPPFNPDAGKPIVMEKAEDRVTLRIGWHESVSPPPRLPWLYVMTIHLRPAP